MYATVFPHTLLCTLLVLYHELKVINYYILEKFSKNAFKIIFKEYCINPKCGKKLPDNHSCDPDVACHGCEVAEGATKCMILHASSR